MDAVDIWRVGRDLIDQFGDRAETVAAGRAEKAAHEGDQPGERFWRRALAAIRDLRQKVPGRGPA